MSTTAGTMGQRRSAHCALLTAHCSLLTTRCSLPTAHCSLLTSRCSLLPTHFSLLTAHCFHPNAKEIANYGQTMANYGQPRTSNYGRLWRGWCQGVVVVVRVGARACFTSTYSKYRTRPPLPEHRAEVLDTRSSGSCRGRVVANACLGWSYG